MKSVARKISSVATRNGKLHKIIADEHETYGKFRSTGTELTPGKVGTIVELQVWTLSFLKLKLDLTNPRYSVLEF